MDRRLRYFYLYLVILFSVNGIASGNSIGAAKYCQSDSASNMINGWEYYMRSAHTGHPFYISNIFQKGTIDSDLGYGRDVLIMYDCYKDGLIMQILNNGKPYQIVMNPEFIKGFQLHGKKFINLGKYEGVGNEKYRNYYELLFDGNIKLLCAHEKVFSDDNSGSGSSYNANIQWFFYKDSELFELKNSRSLYFIYPEKKKEIKKYLKENQLILKIMPERDWIKLAEFCSMFE